MTYLGLTWDHPRGFNALAAAEKNGGPVHWDVQPLEGFETARENLKAAFNMPLEKAIAYERDLQSICFATDDAQEGRAAFAEKRTPQFKRK
ncbi:enoyl-CoA hydratase-related protein [Phaeobacter sp. J2-8]|uniref:enoyl-CoA hydratase/isomerase family protein n=1 Tax=Phaeobacter sp. J2-8 TaxID=2931394 RepID=UPI001FD0440E|nr:enoyl-CoA hydratase-related protein [Phaeobacter sp. J2-8]MCJ7872787.1 enoyl-CoA hydratase-related protein [Phaeobacter sp. J2-8]